MSGVRRVGPEHQRGTATAHHAGIGAAPEHDGGCVAGATGRIVRPAKVASAPGTLGHPLERLGPPVARIGPEAGPPSQGLPAGLAGAGFRVARPETRQVRAAPSALIVPTDRQDARGLARLLRTGRYRPGRREPPPARGLRARPVGRELSQGEFLAIGPGIRGLPRGCGPEVGRASTGRFRARARAPIAGPPMPERAVAPMLRARGAPRRGFHAPHRAVAGIVRNGGVCRRPTTVPGVGAPVAVTVTSAADDPARCRRSRAAGAELVLTPERCQSGATDVTGGIGEAGGAPVRAAPYGAADVVPTRTVRSSSLRRWALGAAKRRGPERAKVAPARKPATTLRRVWVDGRGVRFGREAAAA